MHTLCTPAANLRRFPVAGIRVRASRPSHTLPLAIAFAAGATLAIYAIALALAL